METTLDPYDWEETPIQDLARQVSATYRGTSTGRQYSVTNEDLAYYNADIMLRVNFGAGQGYSLRAAELSNVNYSLESQKERFIPVNGSVDITGAIDDLGFSRIVVDGAPKRASGSYDYRADNYRLDGSFRDMGFAQ